VEGMDSINQTIAIVLKDLWAASSPTPGSTFLPESAGFYLFSRFVQTEICWNFTRAAISIDRILEMTDTCYFYCQRLWG
jgi:hypothetical protein